MKNKFLLVTVLTAFSVSLFAQTAKVKPYQMFNVMPVKPKRGHEKQFEDGVKAHITKFHPAGPYAAKLWLVTEGSGSDGWYMWVMGPGMYSDIDHQPQGDKTHDDDWTNNVDAHIEEYGESNFWKYQDEISVTPANYSPEHVDIWTMDIKPGMRYQFTDLMKKWKAMWEANKYPFSLRVFYNDLWSAKGKDASIVYSFSKYADFDLDLNWRKDYEAMYGPGSYDNFWKSWNECVESTDEQIRKWIK